MQTKLLDETDRHARRQMEDPTLMYAYLIAALAAAQGGSAAPAAAAPTPSPAAACTASENRQFDFWVGRWDVYGPKGRQVAHSLIEKLYNGCGIRENWMPLAGGNGGSLNIYLPAPRQIGPQLPQVPRESAGCDEFGERRLVGRRHQSL